MKPKKLQGKMKKSLVRNLVTCPIGDDPERDELVRKIWTSASIEEEEKAEEVTIELTREAFLAALKKVTHPLDPEKRGGASS